jgi:hypothetical protein
MRRQANAEAARITESAKRQIEAERQQAVVQLRQEVGTMSTALASKIVGESLEDEVRQKGIVDRFLAELESGTVTPEKVGSRARRAPGSDRLMRGSSRAAAARSRRPSTPSWAGAPVDRAGLGEELFAVSAVVDASPSLRRALADPSRDARRSRRSRSASSGAR